jgi:hypothetical protein
MTPSWERKLSVSDISLIIEFLKTRTPSLYNDIKSHDTYAAQSLLDGFLAYGWTQREILQSKSPLFTKLRQYVDLENIFNQGGGQETSQPASTTEHAAADACGMSPGRPMGSISTPGPVDFSIDDPATPLTDLFATLRQDLLNSPGFGLPSPGGATGVTEMSDMEIDSLLHVNVGVFTLTNGITNYQESIDSLNLDEFVE